MVELESVVVAVALLVDYAEIVLACDRGIAVDLFGGLGALVDNEGASVVVVQ